jgi:hypothetical protein
VDFKYRVRNRWQCRVASGLPGFLAYMAIMQPINAQHLSKVTADLLGGMPDVSRPEALAGSGLDPMLEFAAHAYAPAGREENRWMGTDEFSTIAEGWESEYCYGLSDERGLSLETSFGNETALIRLWADYTNPQLGNGLLAMLQIPFLADPQTVANDCATLNHAETGWTDIPQFGCWHSLPFRDGQEALAFSMFVPNALYRPGIATHAFAWMLQRARQLREERWPDLTDKPLPEIFEARLAGD